MHERSEESDFLLLILRDLIKVRKDLTVILMSATLNADLFSDYFEKVPVLEIPGTSLKYLFYVVIAHGYLKQLYLKTCTNNDRNKNLRIAVNR